MFPTSQIAELNLRPVVVATDAGLPISVGRLLVTFNGSTVRVDLEFETERLRCVLRVSPEKWPALVEQWDGEATRYVLPHGDGFWMDERAKHKRRVVEEFLRGGRAPTETG